MGEAAVKSAGAPLSGQIAEYPYRIEIATRWGDNDMLGHLNNVVYNRCIEDIVTKFTRFELDVDWLKDDCYPVTVETLCRFHKQLSWPDPVFAGLTVQSLGNSSVTYAIGLFGEDVLSPAATGTFVHVYIDRVSQRPVPIPIAIRNRLEKIVLSRAAE